MAQIDDIQTALNALTARVNSIDGVGLPGTIISDLAVLQAQIAGVSKDLRQALLVIQQQMNQQKVLVQQYITLVNTKLGV